MKYESLNFITGLLLGLIIAGLISNWPSFVSRVSIALQSSQSLPQNDKQSVSSITPQNGAAVDERSRSRQTNLIQEKPYDPRLAFLVRKPQRAADKPSGSDTLKKEEIFSKALELGKERLPKKPDAISPSSVTTSTSPSSTSSAPDTAAASSTTYPAAKASNDTSKFATKRSRCASLFGERQYLPEKFSLLPPMLYTFPGSGNTWCRLLIEYATGIYTGSVYNDDKLLSALPGEFTCNWRVSAVKAHPHTHRATELLSGHFNSDNGKCNRGNVKRFERAILLIRDPFDSIWSEFQRRVTQSHVSGIPREAFSWPRWQANAANLAHAYLDMWKLDHDLIERQRPKEDYLYLKYEDLKSKATRVATLQQIVDFLRLPHMKSLSTKQLLKRLDCAFVLADNREAHRVIDKSLFMTKDEAYKEEIVCRMWNLFSSYASKHGYGPRNGFNCTGYPKIPRINVGPHGDYDHRWVSPGQKLIDFRGKLFRNNSLITNPDPMNSNNNDQQSFELQPFPRNPRLKRKKPQFDKPLKKQETINKVNLLLREKAGEKSEGGGGTFQEIEQLVLKKRNANQLRKSQQSLQPLPKVQKATP